jgi:hypothetical protein
LDGDLHGGVAQPDGDFPGLRRPRRIPPANACPRLGVAVSRIRLDGRTIALADARLGAGWHAFEADGTGGGWRWTGGDAALDVAGADVLEVEVAMTERYWLTQGRAASRVA